MFVINKIENKKLAMKDVKRLFNRFIVINDSKHVE